MANNYMLFSDVLYFESDEEREWMKKQFEEITALKDGIVMSEGVERISPLTTEDDIEYVGARGLRDYVDGDGDVDFQTEWGDGDDDDDKNSGNISFFTEESGSLEQVTHLVQKFLKKFRKSSDWWRCDFAHTCSKPRVGEFGGGGVVVTAETQYWHGSWDEGARLVDRHKKLGYLVDLWKEHPQFSRRDWRYEVIDDNTIAGYWDWVMTQIEQHEDEDANAG